jgi:DNA-binding MltR family transcriptional regulator
LIVDQPNQFDHRGMVLRAACELEAELASLLLVFMRSVNSKLAEASARKELFSETGLLSSLTKSVRLARHLGLLTEDQVHDLRVVADLRNGYAHGRQRDQFYRDPASSAQLRTLRLYLSSRQLFVEHSDQAIFLACIEQLKLMLQAQAQAFAVPA